MSIAYQSARPAPFGAIAVFRIVSVAEQALGAVASWRSRCATEAALVALSDAQLADIGLHRGELARVALELSRR